MAKKKSKNQKYKKNQKRKIQQTQNKNNVKSNVKKDNNIIQNKNKKVTNNQKNVKTKKTNIEKTENKNTIKKTNNKIIDKSKSTKTEKNKPIKEKQIVDKNKIIYNVALKKENKKIEEQQKIKNGLFKRLLYELKENLHIIFNAIIIVTFIVMLIGFIRIRVLSTSAITYICAIVLFLMSVAISYNKYLSGKIFTLILTLGMGFAIYNMQYTYDFIRNLNSNLYEYKTYYVVTFDNGSNKSIYSINNKKVGLLKDNCINIERMLDTKLDHVNYIEYDNINSLFDDFYNQKFRAILVNENQYKYLNNHIHKNSKKVKILYEFEANAKKQM